MSKLTDTAMAVSWTDSSVCSQGQAGTGCNPCCLYLALTLSFLLVLLLQITSRPSRLVPWSSLTNEGFCWSKLTNQRPWLNFIHSSWNSYISYEFHLKFGWNVRISAKTYNNYIFIVEIILAQDISLIHLENKCIFSFPTLHDRFSSSFPLLIFGRGLLL